MSGAGYATGHEHLRDELARVDALVRARTVRWRMTIGETKPASLWGMVHVSDGEIAAYLESPFMLPGAPLPDELRHAVAPHLEAAGRARQRIDARLAATPPERLSPFRCLVERLGLGPLEADVLIACLLPELDPRYRRLYAYLDDDASRLAPSAELILQILHPGGAGDAEARAVLGAGGALRSWLLLELTDEGVPLPSRGVRLDEWLVGHLLGSGQRDDRLAGALEPAVAERGEDLIGDAESIETLRRLARRIAERREPPPVLMLQGPRGSGRLAAARAVCGDADLPLLVVDCAAALRLASPFEETLARCHRQARLAGAALCWAGCDELLGSGVADPRGERLLAWADAAPGLTILTAGRAWDPVGRFRERPFLRVAVRMPDYGLRRRLWRESLPPAEAFAAPVPERGALADLLAGRFQLSPGQMADALAAARAEAIAREPARPLLTPEDINEGCRRQSGRRLDGLARRIEPRPGLSFEDLVLPAASLAQLAELRARIRRLSRVHNRLGFDRRLPLGRGLVVMFTGSSGTGKTMAAELLALEQGVDLYKVDLAAVVSKYVGETEKNLGSVFADAEDSNAVVFFDEADALFGRRGEVHDARDRWANIEVNYLLQRVEEYTGPVILASNLRQNIDEAFMRRIHVVVDFPFPDADARLRIWSGMFPPGVDRPCDDDLAPLAERFRLAGGSIRNIVVDAAVRALSEDEDERPAITVRHLVQATVREYQKLGRPITKGEFGEDLYAWLEEDLLEIAGR